MSVNMSHPSAAIAERSGRNEKTFVSHISPTLFFLFAQFGYFCFSTVRGNTLLKVVQSIDPRMPSLSYSAVLSTMTEPVHPDTNVRHGTHMTSPTPVQHTRSLDISNKRNRLNEIAGHA